MEYNNHIINNHKNKNNRKIIYIRNELNKFEHRTPIIPNDISILINHGYIVYIETSNHRIFSDEEYENFGAIITSKKWHDDLFKNALIVGIKEIENIQKLSNHLHLYFSHTYKNQINSKYILEEFKKSNSILHDFEFFYNKNKKRIISFGFYAGIVGCMLGLLQYIKKNIYKTNIKNLKYWNNKENILKHILLYKEIFDNVKIAVIGSNGNCGNGVTSILNKLNFNYIIINKNENKSNLQKYDILFNCILLDENFNEIWFDKNTIFNKNIIICDISCDYSKENNPIQIYSENTTWENPVYSYNDFVDIIAINNLPSLLPKESSIYFSDKCAKLIIEREEDKNNYWKNNQMIFYNQINKLE